MATTPVKIVDGTGLSYRTQGAIKIPQSKDKARMWLPGDKTRRDLFPGERRNPRLRKGTLHDAERILLKILGPFSNPETSSSLIPLLQLCRLLFLVPKAYRLRHG
jgi:hypothetical protein